MKIIAHSGSGRLLAKPTFMSFCEQPAVEGTGDRLYNFRHEAHGSPTIALDLGPPGRVGSGSGHAWTDVGLRVKNNEINEIRIRRGRWRRWRRRGFGNLLLGDCLSWPQKLDKKTLQQRHNKPSGVSAFCCFRKRATGKLLPGFQGVQEDKTSSRRKTSFVARGSQLKEVKRSTASAAADSCVQCMRRHTLHAAFRRGTSETSALRVKVHKAPRSTKFGNPWAEALSS